MLYVLHSLSDYPYKVDTIIFLMLWHQKLRFREIKNRVQGHTAGCVMKQVLNPWLFDSRALVINLHSYKTFLRNEIFENNVW